MNNKFCNRFYESRLSVNLKSKTCPELCRRIQNLKWLGLSVIACVFLVAAGVTEAQQTKKLPLIGYLGNRSPAEALGLDAFRQGLRDLGYTEGQNIAIEYRYFEGKLERLPSSPQSWSASTVTSLCPQASKPSRRLKARPRRFLSSWHSVAPTPFVAGLLQTLPAQEEILPGWLP